LQLLQLEYFLKVAHYEHVSKAAYELEISQASLSKSLARLEADIGIQLFDRKGKQIQLNEYGKIYKEKVEKALQLLDDAESEMCDRAGLGNGNITLGVMTSCFLPKLVSGFLSQRPNTKISQHVMSDDEMVAELKNGKTDICISTSQLNDKEIEWNHLFNEEVYLLVSKKHPLATKDVVSLEELKNESFITFPVGLNWRVVTDDFCKQAGFIPNIKFEGEELSIILNLVKEGTGITFLPKYAYSDEDLKHLKKIRLAEPYCYRLIGLAWLKEKNQKRAVIQFKNYLLDFIKKEQMT
jgi:DNA-binding transcriptional LysR family regulator